MTPALARIREFFGRVPRKSWLRAGLAALGIAAIAAAFLLRPILSRPHPQTAYYSARLQGVPLLGDFVSYESVAEAQARLAAMAYRFERSRSYKLRSRKYPPRDLDTLTVENYVHLAAPGRLALEFFNDRLYEASFEPEEAGIRRYAAALHAAEPGLKRDRVGKSESLRGELRIAANVDLARSKVGRSLDTRPYVLWQDLRLKRQLAEWENAYGPLALPAP